MGLRSVREDLDLSREELAYLTNPRVTIGTIRNAEIGCRVTNGKLLPILEALNKARADKDLPPVTIEDLGVKLY